jgi:hypothetical protein
MRRTIKMLESIAKKSLEDRTLEQLVDMFEETTIINEDEIYSVRIWLLDEIEKRNPKGFDKWLDLEEPEDKELRKYVL